MDSQFSRVIGVEFGVGAWDGAVQQSPRENGYLECFNDMLRDKLLNRESFEKPQEARVLIERCGSTTTPSAHTRPWGTEPPRLIRSL